MAKSDNGALELMVADILEKQNALEKNMPSRHDLEAVMRTVLKEQQDGGSKDMIPLPEYRLLIGDMVERNERLQKEVAVMRTECDRLKGQIREHASSQSVRRLFQWLFNRRHMAVLIILTFYNLLFVVMICTLSRKDRMISNLRDDSLKYRFIRARGVAPKTCAIIDDWFYEGDQEMMRQVRQTVLDYEKEIRHAADSIVRKERLKMTVSKRR